MAKPKRIGSGWHKQSVRHSRARRLGKAGGKYATQFGILTPQGKVTKSMSIKISEIKSPDPLAYAYGYFQGKTGQPISKNKGLATEYIRGYEEGKKQKDTDGDGVIDSKDCEPFNPKKQDTYELEPRYDSRKSFYGKARVETGNGVKKLYSYNTLVAEIRNGTPIVYGTYSATTLRHITEFLKQSGFKAETSDQIIKDYPEKEDYQKLWEKKQAEEKQKKPKIKDKMTEQEAEDLYKYELSEEKINTETTPHYDSFNEYKRMLEDMGVRINNKPKKAKKQVVWLGGVPKKDDFGETITDEFIDGKTTLGAWGLMTPSSYRRFGIGIRTGLGQRYKKIGSDFVKVEG